VSIEAIEANLRRALVDPSFHRRHFVTDHALPGERHGRLLQPQRNAVEAVEKIVANARSRATGPRSLVIRSARQTMKNDVDATVICRMLHRYRKEGGIVIRTAPSYSPQLLNSRRRIEWMISRDLLFNASGEPHWRYGHMLCHDKVEVHLLSGSRGGNPEGATASLLLSVDEAHRFDRGVFEDRFGPMVAIHNAPTVMYGIAADRADLLYEHLIANLKEAGDPEYETPGGRLIDLPTVQQYPAEVWCDLLPTYRQHVDIRERRLGADHPSVLTNYHLMDIEALGSLFSAGQQTSLTVGQDPRGLVGGRYETVALVDLAGEVEDAAEVPGGHGDIHARNDACAVLIFAVDRVRTKFDWPACSLIDMAWWVGLPLEGGNGVAEFDSVKGRLDEILGRYRPSTVVVDARGVGYGTARWIGRNYPGRVVEYASSAASKSEDLYGFLGMLNAGAVEVFKGDGSPEWVEWEREVRGARKKISAHSLLDLLRPRRKLGEPPARVDLIRAASYLPRAVSGAEAGHFLDAYVERDDPHALERRMPEPIGAGESVADSIF
jgi:hypothetical protein